MRLRRSCLTRWVKHGLTEGLTGLTAVEPYTALLPAADQWPPKDA
jgi:hypothetical protein